MTIEEKNAFLKALNPMLVIGKPGMFLDSIEMYFIFILVIKSVIQVEDFHLLVSYLIEIKYPISFEIIIADEDAEGDGESSPNTILSSSKDSVHLIVFLKFSLILLVSYFM